MSAIVNAILTPTFLVKRAIERRKNNIAVSDVSSTYNTSKANDVIYGNWLILFYLACLIGFFLLTTFGINFDSFVESYLFTNYLMMGVFGFIVPISFYFMNKDLRKWIKRDLLQI